MEKEQLAAHLIDKYRETVARRYNYRYLSEQFDLPDQLTEDVVEDLRNYFLTWLYPPAAERKKVDEAFESLRSFIQKPAKTWALLGSMANAIFRFGMQFPQALKAGMVSLESYLDAKRFEQELLEAALKLGLTPPLSDADFEKCIAHLPRRDLNRFVHHVISLFESMANTRLLKKTILIMQDVLRKIKANKRLYSENDRKGIELGIAILQAGYDLFSHYPESLKQEIIAIIRANEENYLKQVFGSA
ncbi:MAG: hypothetical protein KatS3mg031_1059 [Chitinophagales bacterium]|nr:MAG: hypothetical protein KatS3mg031_1059 [Chitinophagales bacterium]